MPNTSEDRIKRKQVRMHRSFFEKSRLAIDNGFYLEAIFLEYAAIESRLEVICGLLGFPCNKTLSPNVRKTINITNRIECIKTIRNQHGDLFVKTKLDDNFFKDKGCLRKWVNKRNMYIHGLYKNAAEYESRKRESKKLAEQGEVYARLLYNEAKRLRRLKDSHPDLFVGLNGSRNGCPCVKEITLD